MEKQTEKQIQADVIFTNDESLKTRYATRADGSYTIRVGRGDRRDVLACKELYGKAVKTALELECTACSFELDAASELGQEGLFAAVEGVCGGAYQKKFALDGRWEPELACSFTGDEACANGLHVETVVQCFYTRTRPGRQAGADLVAHRVRYADKPQALPEHSGEMLAHRSTVVAESMMNAKYREF